MIHLDAALSDAKALIVWEEESKSGCAIAARDHPPIRTTGVRIPARALQRGNLGASVASCVTLVTVAGVRPAPRPLCGGLFLVHAGQTICSRENVMAERSTSNWSVSVDRPVDDVFAYLADVTRHHEWSPKDYRIENLSENPIKVGTTFTSYGWIPRDKTHRNDVEVTEYDPPRRLVLTCAEPAGSFINTFTLTPAGSGTRVDKTMDMPKPGGFLGVIYPLLLATVVKSGVQKGLDMFKTNLEKSDSATL